MSEQLMPCRQDAIVQVPKLKRHHSDVELSRPLPGDLGGAERRAVIDKCILKSRTYERIPRMGLNAAQRCVGV